MKLIRPKSLVQLIFAGFILVVLPLILALLYAVIAVDKLAQQNQLVVAHAVKATRGSHMLIEQINMMERNMRQYQVLGDQALLQVYDGNRTRFIDTLGQLGMLKLPESLSTDLGELAGNEYAFYSNLVLSNFEMSSGDVSNAFTRLAVQVQNILAKSRQLLNIARTIQHNLGGKIS
ncbi:hypothetical protein ACFL2V_04255, partial [Pseudomonadota bacterium]